MKKLCGVLICFFLLTFISSARIIEVADAGITDKLRAVIAAKNAGAPAPGGDYDDITLWIGWENCGGTPCQTDYTLGADDYSAGDSVATRNSATEVNSAAAMVGSFGADATTGNDYYSLDVSDGDIISGTSGVIAMWFKSYRATWADYDQLFTISGNSGEYLRIEFYSGDTLRVNWYDTGQLLWTDVTPPFNITVSNNFFVQLTYNATTNLIKLEVADADDVALTEWVNTTATAFAPITPVTVNIGCFIAGSDMYIDNFMVSNDPTRDFFTLRNETTSPK